MPLALLLGSPGFAGGAEAEPVQEAEVPEERQAQQEEASLEQFGFAEQGRSELRRERMEDVVEEDLGTNVVVEPDGDVVAEGFSLAEDEIEGIDVAIEP